MEKDDTITFKDSTGTKNTILKNGDGLVNEDGTDFKW